MKSNIYHGYLYLVAFAVTIFTLPAVAQTELLETTATQTELLETTLPTESSDAFPNLNEADSGNPGDSGVIGDPGGDPDTGVPVDGGLSLLLAAGAGYGANKLRKHRKKK